MEKYWDGQAIYFLYRRRIKYRKVGERMGKTIGKTTNKYILQSQLQIEMKISR